MRGNYSAIQHEVQKQDETLQSGADRLSQARWKMATCIVQRSILVQGEERRIQKHGVVVLHHYPLVLRLDPWLVLIGCAKRGTNELPFSTPVFTDWI